MPRIPDVDENLVGCVCVCSTGRIAVVTGRAEFSFARPMMEAGNVEIQTQEEQKEMWVGLGLDGKGCWASSNPIILANNAADFHDKLMGQFGGALSFLD